MAALEKNCLLAEDNEFLRTAMLSELANTLPHCFHLYCVVDGDEALKAIQGLPFNDHSSLEREPRTVEVKEWHVLFLDGSMPIEKRDHRDAGIEIAKRARAVFQQNVKIYACSSDERKEFDDKALFDGNIGGKRVGAFVRKLFPSATPGGSPKAGTPSKL